MKQYHQALEHILAHGKQKSDRTGTGTLSYFGMQQRYPLAEGFPAVTTKKLAWRAVVSELLWFLEGSGDERRLAEILHGTRDYAEIQEAFDSNNNPIMVTKSLKTIWTANAQAPYWKNKAKFDGDLGRVYGVQWRNWTNKDGEVTDQLLQLVEGIKKDPAGRRHIITAWNPGELDQMALPPCHCFAQFDVTEGKLSCQLYQRSNDFFLGCPFNIASYALFTHMVAQVCDLEVGDFVHTTGDAHIYSNHIDQVMEQLQRTHYSMPQLWLNPDIKDITKFTMNDIKLEGYESWPAISAPMAV